MLRLSLSWRHFARCLFAFHGLPVPQTLGHQLRSDAIGLLVFGVACWYGYRRGADRERDRADLLHRAWHHITGLIRVLTPIKSYFLRLLGVKIIRKVPASDARPLIRPTLLALLVLPRLRVYA